MTGALVGRCRDTERGDCHVRTQSHTGRGQASEDRQRWELYGQKAHSRQATRSKEEARKDPHL